MTRAGGSYVGDAGVAANGCAGDTDVATRGWAGGVEAAAHGWAGGAEAGAVGGALEDTVARGSAGEVATRDPATRGSAGNGIRVSAVGRGDGDDDPACNKDHVGPMGTGMGLVKVSRNSKSTREGVTGCSAKGKENSSKITWREMMILLELVSRQWYPL